MSSMGWILGIEGRVTLNNRCILNSPFLLKIFVNDDLKYSKMFLLPKVNRISNNAAKSSTKNCDS